MKDMALGDALKLWQMRTQLDTAHLDAAALQAILGGTAGDAELNHLALCPGCRKRLWALQDAAAAVEAAVEDYVLPLAAQDENPPELMVTTAGGKFNIELRRILSEPTNRAVLMVHVRPPLNLEGKTLVVKDTAGRELMRGRVGCDGRVSAIIEDHDTLFLKGLTISEC